MDISTSEAWEKVGLEESDNPEKPVTTLSSAEKGWKRMVVQLAAYSHASDAMAMMEYARADGVASTSPLECSHPAAAHHESNNSKWAKCLACKSRLWTRPLTAMERVEQLNRKAARLSQKKERERMSQEVPFDPPKTIFLANPHHTRPKNSHVQTATPSGSSTSGATTDIGRLANAMQADAETLAKMADAIHHLSSRHP